MSENETMVRRVLRVLAEVVVGIYVIVDGLIAPLFRPIMRFLSSLALIRRIERWIVSLPPYVILVLLVLPFAIAELTKVYAVFLMGTGHFKTGFTIFVGAYIVTILGCERILHAGKPQLMTIGWFAVLYTWIIAFKDRILDWFRATAVWRLAVDLKQKARLAARRAKLALTGFFSGKAGWLFRR
ncbi:MAG: hypothetical protein P4L76_10835 [Beijerinckiaceae bacterium]|nr:hypothetical protein [Beijerinckiaceae bacterium]